MPYLLQLNEITKIYTGSGTAVKAIDNINLSVVAGELLAIVGVSGSGKSTLMNIIGLLDKPTLGEYFINDEKVSLIKNDQLSELRNKKIGFVFQQFYLLPRLNAVQNILMPLLYRGMNLRAAKNRAIALLERLEIGYLANKKPNQMSGGEQQRIAIARALIGEPDILLADEPTGSLDTKTGQDIMNLFISLNKNENKTIIIITHDQSISKQCNRVIILRDGRIINDSSSNKKVVAGR